MITFGDCNNGKLRQRQNTNHNAAKGRYQLPVVWRCFSLLPHNTPVDDGDSGGGGGGGGDDDDEGGGGGGGVGGDDAIIIITSAHVYTVRSTPTASYLLLHHIVISWCILHYNNTTLLIFINLLNINIIIQTTNTIIFVNIIVELGTYLPT